MSVVSSVIRRLRAEGLPSPSSVRNFIEASLNRFPLRKRIGKNRLLFMVGASPQSIEIIKSVI